MEHDVLNHSLMEEPIASGQLFPISEFIDHFDSFPSGSFPAHWHHELELQIILKGSAEYQVNGVSYLVNCGEAIYIAPNAIHNARQLSPATIGYNIVLSLHRFRSLMRIIHCESYVRPMMNQSCTAFLILSDHKAGHRILEILRRMYYTENTGNAYELFLLENSLGIWRNLLSLLPQRSQNEIAPPQILREQRMRLMLDYIHQNYAQPISVSEISAAANVSQSECFRYFTEFSNSTPAEYLNEYRLLQASQKLTSSQQSMSDICFSVGFNSTSYFSKRFKQRYGMTPKEYRKKNQI